MRRSFVYRAVALAGALALSALAGRAQAQTGTATVRGTVIDSSTRQGVPNAQVSVGTARRVLTDETGRFTISQLPAGATTVRVQRIGFGAAERTVTLTSGQTTTVEFAVRPVATTLSAVVATGYATTSRADVSSAVAQVAGNEVQGAAVAGIDAALQGKAPGVQVTQNAGNPGNGITVRIRGASSISASNQPLYVIDGVPMNTDNLSQIGYGGQDLTAVTGLSPDEIETIDVLKDAAAAAIYGSRASNGVVMITTKRGRPGRTRFSLNANVGQQSVTRRLDMMNASEYVQFMTAAAENDGYSATYALNTFGTDSINTDWQSAVFRKAAISDVSLQAQGGGDRFTYLLSGSRFDQPGVIIGSGYNRINSRMNMDFTATPKFTLTSSIGVAREVFHRIENDNTIEGAGANAMANQPNVPLFKDNGQFAGPDEGLAYANPAALGTYNNSPSTTLRLIGSVEGAYSFTDRLRWNNRLGTDVYNLEERRWDSPRVEGTYAAGAVGVGTQSNNTATKYLGESWLSFDALRSTRQTLGTTVGGSLEFNRNELVYLRGEGFGSDQFQYPGNAGKVTGYDGSAGANNLASVFGRANYSLLNRYLLTASLRTDGSSRFAQGQRWGVFPAASLGWTLSEEPWANAVKNLMSLKVRASYGVTGNQSIPTNFGFLTSFARANYAGEPGISPNALGNPDLRWETTKESDLGLDVGFLDGRISVIPDVYIKKTSDLLVQRPIATTSGYSSIWDNVGNVENRGFDLQITTENLRAHTPSGLSWTTNFNISHNKNEVTKLFQDQPITSGIRSINRVAEGQPIGEFYTVKYLGVDNTGNACLENIERDANGKITSRTPDCTGENINADDRQYVGSPWPKYYGGLRNELSWHGFDANTFLEFSKGKSIFNLFRLFSDDAGYNPDNKIKSALNYWKQPGDEKKKDIGPRPSWDGTSNAYDVSSRYVEDGSYIRLSELTFGYKLPSRLVGGAGLQETRLYVSGRNLHLWTKYKGYDPDVNSNGSDSNISLGTEFYAYPRAAVWSFGVSTNW